MPTPGDEPRARRGVRALSRSSRGLHRERLWMAAITELAARHALEKAQGRKSRAQAPPASIYPGAYRGDDATDGRAREAAPSLGYFRMDRLGPGSLFLGLSPLGFRRSRP